jgi:hypothetical protein
MASRGWPAAGVIGVACLGREDSAVTGALRHRATCPDGRPPPWRFSFGGDPLKLGVDEGNPSSFAAALVALALAHQGSDMYLAIHVVFGTPPFRNDIDRRDLGGAFGFEPLELSIDEWDTAILAGPFGLLALIE